MFDPKIEEFQRVRFRRKKKKIKNHDPSPVAFWSARPFSPLRFTLRRSEGSPCALLRAILSTPDSPYTPTESPSSPKGSRPPCFNPPFMLLPLSPDALAHTRGRAPPVYVHLYIYAGPVLLTIAMTVPSWQFTPSYYIHPLHTHTHKFTKQKKKHHGKKGLLNRQIEEPSSIPRVGKMIIIERRSSKRTMTKNKLCFIFNVQLAVV